MPQIKLTIKTNPVAKESARTTFRDGKVRTYIPHKTSTAYKILVAEIQKHQQWCFARCTPIKMTLSFYRQKSPSLPKREKLPFRRPDLDNFVKLVSDATKGLLIKDDSQITSLVAKKRWALNGHGYVEILLQEDKESQDG